MKSGGALLAALSLTGCSQLFGLDAPVRTAMQDAATDSVTDDVLEADAPPDAPLAPTLVDIIQRASAGANLLVALDAGAYASYDGGDATWRNIAPGATVHFHRGAGAAAAADDPTFHGTAGARTADEYFTFDGDDVFVESMAGWGDDEFPKAQAKVTLLAVTWQATIEHVVLFTNCTCTANMTSTPGILWYQQATDDVLTIYQEGDVVAGDFVDGTAKIPPNLWTVSTLVLDAGANNTDVRFGVDTTFETLANVDLPFSTAAMTTAPAMIGLHGDGTQPAPAGTRIAMLAVWNRVLSNAELTAIVSAIHAERY